MRIDFEPPGQGFEEPARIGGIVFGIAFGAAVIGKKRLIPPDRHAVFAPVTPQRPARQRFARIPLALAEVQQRTGSEPVAQFVNKVHREPSFVRSECAGGPFGAIGIVDRNESGLAAHGQADVARAQFLVHAVTERDDFLPLLFAVRAGDARRFEDPVHGHLVREFRLARVESAGNRRGAAGVGRAGERDVTFAGEETGGGVEADPARSGQVNLGPGVQIGEVGGGANRAFERLHIGRELNQISGNEACGKSQMAQDLDKKPGGIPAGAGTQAEGFLAALDTGFHADYIAGFVLQTLVQADQEVDGAKFFARNLREPGGEFRPGGLCLKIRPQFTGKGLIVSKRIIFRRRLQEKVERIEDSHFRDQIHFHEKLGGGFGEDEARQVVSLWILLPVDEVVCGLDLQRISENRGAAVRRGTEPDYLGTEVDPAVITVACFMIQRNVNRHNLRWYLRRCKSGSRTEGDGVEFSTAS